jgi:hypothetical protein
MNDENGPNVRPTIVMICERMFDIEKRRITAISSINSKITSISGMDSTIKANVDDGAMKPSSVSFLKDLERFLYREGQDIEYMENIAKNLKALI